MKRTFSGESWSSLGEHDVDSVNGGHYLKIIDDEPLNLNEKAEKEAREEEFKKTHPNRPPDRAWHQQRIPRTHPQFMPGVALAIFYGGGFLLLVLGVVILAQSWSLDEFSIVYDGKDACLGECEDGFIVDGEKCRLSPDQVNTFSEDHTCTVNVEIDGDMKAPVYVMFSLENYHQNHRRYVDAVRLPQYSNNFPLTASTDACNPWQTTRESVSRYDITLCDPSSPSVDGQCGEVPGTSSLYEPWPCGLAGSTMFNDVIKLQSSDYQMTMSGLARDFIHNDVVNPGTDVLDNDRFILPYDRQEFYFLVQREAYQEPNNLTAWTEPSEEWGMRNSLFRNWIQLAALSDFRKPYAKINSDIPAGTTLSFSISSNFLVQPWNGNKALLVTEVAWFGSRNILLGWLYIATAALFVGLGATLHIRVAKYRRPLADARVLKWKEKPYSAKRAGRLENIFSRPSETRPSRGSEGEYGLQ